MLLLQSYPTSRVWTWNSQHVSRFTEEKSNLYVLRPEDRNKRRLTHVIWKFQYKTTCITYMSQQTPFSSEQKPSFSQKHNTLFSQILKILKISADSLSLVAECNSYSHNVRSESHDWYVKIWWVQVSGWFAARVVVRAPLLQWSLINSYHNLYTYTHIHIQLITILYTCNLQALFSGFMKIIVSTF